MADVEEEMRSCTKEEPLRRVADDGRRMVKRPMAMDKVRRLLAIDPRPVVVPSPESDVRPATLSAMKLFHFGVGVIREAQDIVRRDLATKGHVLGWVTDDEDDE